MVRAGRTLPRSAGHPRAVLALAAILLLSVCSSGVAGEPLKMPALDYDVMLEALNRALPPGSPEVVRAPYWSSNVGQHQGSLPMMVLELSYRGYKHFVSSQDSATCAFTPSCSTFALNAVRQYGTLSGVLLTLDRLQRDSPGAVGHYPVELPSGLLIDPVNSYCPAVSGACP